MSQVEVKGRYDARLKQIAAHRQWMTSLNDNKATFEQRAAAAEKLRECVRVGQS